MSNQNLQRLLWRHYRGLFLTAIIVMAVAGLKDGLTVINQPQIYISRGAFSAVLDGGSWRVVAAVVSCFTLGLTLFLNDNWTNFNHYLFALPVARHRIYRQKIGLLLVVITGSYAVMETLFILMIHNVLPQRHAYLDWSLSWRLLLGQYILFVSLAMIAATFGLWVGHVLASTIAGVVFCCSLIFALDGVTNLLAGILRVKYNQVNLLTIMNVDHWSGVSVTVVVGLVVCGLLYWLDRWAFNHLSLENSREFFRFPQLRSAVLWFSIVYLTIAVSCSAFGLTVLGILTDHYREHMPLSVGIVMAIVVAYLTWSLGRWFLYRPDQFRQVWTFKRLDQN